MKDMATALDISEPSMPRKRKIPKRLETGTSEDESPVTVDQYYRKMYFQAFDLIFNCITDRFDQKGFKVYRKVQDVLLN